MAANGLHSGLWWSCTGVPQSASWAGLPPHTFSQPAPPEGGGHPTEAWVLPGGSGPLHCRHTSKPNGWNFRHYRAGRDDAWLRKAFHSSQIKKM